MKSELKVGQEQLRVLTSDIEEHRPSETSESHSDCDCPCRRGLPCPNGSTKEGYLEASK